VTRTATHCLRLEHSIPPELRKNMTKVIPPGSDEMVGCENAYRAFADSYQRPTSGMDGINRS
jgi:hypothetical protein